MANLEKVLDIRLNIVMISISTIYTYGSSIYTSHPHIILLLLLLLFFCFSWNFFIQLQNIWMLVAVEDFTFPELHLDRLEIFGYTAKLLFLQSLTRHSHYTVTKQWPCSDCWQLWTIKSLHELTNIWKVIFFNKVWI